MLKVSAITPRLSSANLVEEDQLWPGRKKKHFGRRPRRGIPNVREQGSFCWTGRESAPAKPERRTAQKLVRPPSVGKSASL